MKRPSRGVLIVLVLGLLPGACSSAQKKEKRDLYRFQLDPLIGREHPRELIELMGDPGKTGTSQGQEHWLYQFKGRKFPSDPFTPHLSFMKEPYEELELIFDPGGIFRSWTIKVVN